MSRLTELSNQIKEHFDEMLVALTLDCDQLTIEVAPEHIQKVGMALRDEKPFQFNMLIDVCGVDYLDYGLDEWATESTTTTGFSRGVEDQKQRERTWNKPRFAVVYHLLSLELNQRIRIRCFLKEDVPMIDSVVNIWNCANWFEREAFDLYGILFNGHPDLRRILTDYGFIGHPFRKDFPLIGNVAMRYDAKIGRVIYEPVDIEPRTLVPKVIRPEVRYEKPEEGNV